MFEPEHRRWRILYILRTSGCGKTTSLRALVGFLTPTKGEIMVDGKNVVPMAVVRREIGMVFQSYALFPTMTVYENIAFGLKVKKTPKDQIEKNVLSESLLHLLLWLIFRQMRINLINVRSTYAS